MALMATRYGTAPGGQTRRGQRVIGRRVGGVQSEQTLIILGASGDLSWRFLLPGLGRLLADEPHRRLQLIGSSRREKPDWTQVVAQRFEGYASPAVDHTLQTTSWVAADSAVPADWARLFGACESAPVIYFAVGPDQRWPRAMRCERSRSPPEPGWCWRSRSVTLPTAPMRSTTW